MRHSRVISVLCFVCVLVNSSEAQQQLFTTYSAADGLVANSVRNIFQDSKGFLWIATWEGLSKYDGDKFTNFTMANGLSHNLTNDICESKDGKLFIACNNGSVDVIKHNKVEETVYDNIIINRFSHAIGKKIFAVTDSGGIYDFQNDKLTQVYKMLRCQDIAELNDSLLVLQTEYSLQVLNKQYKLFSELKQASPLFVDCTMYADSRKRLWVGTRAGLKLMSVSNKNTVPVLEEIPFDIPLLKQGWIKEIFEDAEGNMWIGTLYGLVKIEPGGKWHLFNKKNGLPSNDIACVFQDHEKNIWIGTALGLVKLVTKTTIRVYSEENGLFSNNTSFIYPFNDGNVLIGVEKGLQVYNTGENKFYPRLEGESNYYKAANSDLPLLYTGNKIINFNPATRASYSVFSKATPGIAYAVKDKYGNFFISNYDTLFIYSGKQMQQDQTVPYRISALLTDKKGQLWIATWENGLYCIKYSSDNGKVVFISKVDYLPGENIRCLFEDSKGNIWAGTRYHGVFQLNSSDASLTQHFDQTSGLTSNWIRTINEDASGSVWLGFYIGLDKLVPVSKTFRVFNFSRVNNFFANINDIVAANDNSLWLATALGIVNISDGQLEKLPPLPVQITSVSIDSGYNFSAYTSTANLQLSYKQNQIQFEFTAPGYINEKQVLYSYRLLGSTNPKWSQLANVHKISYASLQPGTYQFEVRTFGWNGEWGEPAHFSFYIRPPFWQTTWFIICVTLVAAAIIYLLVKRRIKAIRKESELKQKLAETEMMALRAQMNPHFIFNCLNAIDNLVQTNQKEKATTYLARFAKLIRSVLDSSKNNVVPFQNDYESLQLYLQMEQFRCNNKFSYELTADEELLHSDYKLPPLIVQPFAENAIHHGLLNKRTGDRKLTISAALNNDTIKYTITDNGVGRARAQALKEINKPGHKSYGIATTEERIHLYNQNKKTNDIIITDLWENNQPAGTKVEIHLKIYDHK